MGPRMSAKHNNIFYGLDGWRDRPRGCAHTAAAAIPPPPLGRHVSKVQSPFPQPLPVGEVRCGCKVALPAPLPPPVVLPDLPPVPVLPLPPLKETLQHFPFEQPAILDIGARRDWYSACHISYVPFPRFFSRSPLTSFGPPKRLVPQTRLAPVFLQPFQ